jgi:lipopolysaccharide transport system permease protein
VLQPLLAAGVFSFVFGRVADLDSGGVPYFAFAFAGMLAWNTFSQALTRMSGSLVANAGLISKIFFPRLVLPLSTLGAVLIDFLVALVMMVAVWIVAGVAPSWGLLTLPLWLGALLLLAAGAGLLAAALMVSYRDVQFILPVATQTLLYASPVAYALDAVPESVRWIYQLNPLTGLLEGYRWALLDVGSIDAWPTIWLAICSVSFFLVGSFNFTRMERKFADVI